MSVQALTAVAVLDAAPVDDAQARRTAERIVANERPEVLEDPGLSLSWFCCDRLPPASLTGIPAHEEDQLQAHVRDTPGAVYFVVTIERA
jgi:hypothetical protein